MNTPSSRSRKAYVYVDGFNLYFGILNQNKPGLKWLDLQSWLVKLLPEYEIQKIKFFTAKISGKYDAQKPIRQSLYLRALKTLSPIEIVYGTFLFKKKKIHITQDVDIFARIPEEKGTDVNLAVHLLNDAHNGLFDTAVIVSNDSDLTEAVKIVTQELNLEIGIVNPCDGKRFSKRLCEFATFKKRARKGQISSSQFPASLKDKIGTFTRPPGW